MDKNRLKNLWALSQANLRRELTGSALEFDKKIVYKSAFAGAKEFRTYASDVTPMLAQWQMQVSIGGAPIYRANTGTHCEIVNISQKQVMSLLQTSRVR